jgi:hypothetical protein
MKSVLVLALMLPVMSLASEPAAKPASNSTAHAPIKNAPPTQVDHLKPAKEGKPKSEALAADHSAAPAAHSSTPTEPPVVRYVPPKYTSSTPIVRTVVPSKAPRARAAASHSKKSTHASAKPAADMAVTPGIVRVMPSSSLPAGKVLPTGKLALDTASTPSTGNLASNKPRLTWGETTIVPAAPAPEIYIVRDPELRWQQYSYP